MPEFDSLFRKFLGVTSYTKTAITESFWFVTELQTAILVPSKVAGCQIGVRGVRQLLRANHAHRRIREEDLGARLVLCEQQDQLEPHQYQTQLIYQSIPQRNYTIQHAVRKFIKRKVTYLNGCRNNDLLSGFLLSVFIFLVFHLLKPPNYDYLLRLSKRANFFVCSIRCFVQAIF